MSKCRACGTENMLDDTHRAGTQLMKNLPKDMSEIDSKKQGEDKKTTEEIKDGKSNADGGKDDEGSGDEDKKERKKKKKNIAEEEEEPVVEEGIKLDSEEIGKLLFDRITNLKWWIPCHYPWYSKWL